MSDPIEIRAYLGVGATFRFDNGKDIIIQAETAKELSEFLNGIEINHDPNKFQRTGVISQDNARKRGVKLIPVRSTYSKGR